MFFRKVNKKIIWVLIALLAVILAVILIFGVIYWQSKEVRDLTSRSFIEDRLKQNKPFSFLLLGHGGENHDGKNLTDTIIIAYFDPTQKVTTLINIPRDLWVNIPTNGFKTTQWKINAAYAIGMDDKNYPNKLSSFSGSLGGGNLAKQVVTDVSNIKIDKFISIDFSIFKNTIDALGGIDVTLQRGFDDYAYPIQGREKELCGLSRITADQLVASGKSDYEIFPCRFEHLHFDAGKQHLNGEQALKFVRSRHSAEDGDDFGRSQRQKLVILAIKEKFTNIKTFPFQKIWQLYENVRRNISTDLNLADIRTLILNLDIFSKYELHYISLTNQNILKDETSSDGQSILVPLDNDWVNLQLWIAEKLNQNNSIISPKIRIENASGMPGIAQMAKNRLVDRDFNVIATTQNKQGTIIKNTEIIFYNDKIDRFVVREIEGEFGVSSRYENMLPGQDYNVLIKIGEDYKRRYESLIVD